MFKGIGSATKCKIWPRPEKRAHMTELLRYPTLFLLLVIDPVCTCKILEVIPERPSIKYFNPEYLKWVNFTIKRYGRRSIYYLNLEGHLKHAWGNNITGQFIFFERMSNEYRPSFIQWKWKLCDGILNDPYIGHILARGGLANKTCPLQPGAYHLMNLTIDTGNFKNIWPFEKGRMEFVGQKNDNNITIVIGEKSLVPRLGKHVKPSVPDAVVVSVTAVVKSPQPALDQRGGLRSKLNLKQKNCEKCLSLSSGTIKT
ncbi:hypothetical protein EVAR_27323_1 [Eumeta japonica]|uniref:Uncharacterized protein n=1 Tax=Eumeta variegata TaxID=151549 RepID=A0A4C1UCL5_EUMVA|nr:hypothetical protein EVAR_27323_1 [Eumeta japonica]